MIDLMTNYLPYEIKIRKSNCGTVLIQLCAELWMFALEIHNINGNLPIHGLFIDLLISVLVQLQLNT